jgi:hypothetical protein
VLRTTSGKAGSGAGWPCRDCVRPMWTRFRTSRRDRASLGVSHLRPRAKPVRQRRRRPGVAWIRMSANNQPRDPGSPRCARRPGKQAWGQVGLVAIAPVRCECALGPVGAIEHRSVFPTCVPGRSRCGSDGGDPGSLGFGCSQTINHAIPDRRAAHDVRESRLRVGWPSRNRACPM